MTSPVVHSTEVAASRAAPVPAGLGPVRRRSALRVVVFSGGRGSGVLSRQLTGNPQIALTLAVNGYDDGASTGEVRRLLGACLGPSDFRKNASRLARDLCSCEAALVDLLDLRLPVGCSREEALAALRVIDGRSGPVGELQGRVHALASAAGAPARATVGATLATFERELARTGRPFEFSDCSLGNLVFAGGFLRKDRGFNAAVADFADLLGLPPGLIENVTDGTNAFLVALDLDGHVLGSEEEIVGANRQNRIKEIYLIDRPLGPDERVWLEGASAPAQADFLKQREAVVRVNPRIVERIAEADLIIYSPGTQHSSLFPSYLTPGLSTAIARNLTATKLLITNIQRDAEIAGSSAVDIIERAIYYLKEKGRLSIPTPCLITHYLINDPGHAEPEAPYVPLGRLDSLEDPRLIRIANYEEGVTGRHDAAKILAPFIESMLGKRDAIRAAVLLHDASSPSKVSQTLLEMIRGGIQDLAIGVTVFYMLPEPLEPDFATQLPFAVRHLAGPPAAAAEAFRQAVLAERFDYVILFESSGMYQGEDVVSLASHLTYGRLDAVWGSRRLSVRDIQASYRLRYRHNVLLGAVSYLGSHLLSLAYLLLYGRYISDTLSGARALRAAYVASGIDLTHKRANQHVLSALLRDRAELLETPVQFFPISPERVRRTSVVEGVQALGAIVWRRFRRS